MHHKRTNEGLIVPAAHPFVPSRPGMGRCCMSDASIMQCTQSPLVLMVYKNSSTQARQVQAQTVWGMANVGQLHRPQSFRGHHNSQGALYTPQRNHTKDRGAHSGSGAATSMSQWQFGDLQGGQTALAWASTSTPQRDELKATAAEG